VKPTIASKKNVNVPASPSNAAGEFSIIVAAVRMPNTPINRIANQVVNSSGLEASSARD